MLDLSAVISPVFLLRLALSFLVGGAYIAAVIRISERFGPQLGGILTGMPSTVFISLIFIELTQGPEIMRKTTVLMPVGLAMSSLCLVLFTILLVRRNWRSGAAGGLSLSIWLGILIPCLFHIRGMLISVVLAGVFFTPSLYLRKSLPVKKFPFFALSRKELFFRFCVSGGVIALCVLCAKVMGPRWGGLVGSFPAASLSAMIIVARTHGVGFCASMVKTVPYGIASNIVFLAILFLLIPVWGAVGALLSGYVVSVVLAIFFYKRALRK